MNVLIVDTSKSSLIMTTECCKACLPKSNIEICLSGKEALSKIKKKNFDLVFVDFQLPDCDGVMLSKHLKLSYKMPIIITAYPENIVEKAIKSELFHYNDSLNWLQKPIRPKTMSQQLKQILNKNFRLTKRYLTSINTNILLQSNKNKKEKGKILNLSIGGALLKYNNLSNIKEGLELNIKIDKNLQSSKIKNSFSEEKNTPLNIKAKVIWNNSKKNLLGLQFLNLSEYTLLVFEKIMRISKET